MDAEGRSGDPFALGRRRWLFGVGTVAPDPRLNG